MYKYAECRFCSITLGGHGVCTRPPAGVMKNEIVRVVVQYVLSNVAMHVFNKLAVDKLGLPGIFYIIQALGAVAILKICQGKLPAMHSSRIWRWLPIAALFSALCVSFIKTAAVLNLTASVVFRNLAPLVNVLWEFVGKGRIVSRRVLATLFGTALGCYVYGHDEAKIEDIEGICWLAFNLIVNIAYLSQMEASTECNQPTAGMSTIDKLFYNYVLSLPFAIGATLYFDELASVIDRVILLSWLDWLWVVVTCVAGVFIDLSEIELLERLSATTCLVIAGMDELIVILIGTLVLKDSISLLSGFGCMMAIACSLRYGMETSQ